MGIGNSKVEGGCLPNYWRVQTNYPMDPPAPARSDRANNTKPQQQQASLFPQPQQQGPKILPQKVGENVAADIAQRAELSARVLAAMPVGHNPVERRTQGGVLSPPENRRTIGRNRGVQYYEQQDGAQFNNHMPCNGKDSELRKSPSEPVRPDAFDRSSSPPRYDPNTKDELLLESQNGVSISVSTLCTCSLIASQYDI